MPIGVYVDSDRHICVFIIILMKFKKKSKNIVNKEKKV